jgi:hypothetical protein
VDLRPGLVICTLPRFSSGTLDAAKIEANSGVIGWIALAERRLAPPI